MKTSELVIILMKREYDRKKIVLPDSFWNLPQYKHKFARHMMTAAKFFRAYDKEAIWNVIEREKWCFSLNAKCLPDMIEKEQERIKLERLRASMDKKEPETKIENINVTRFSKKNNNLLDD